MLEEYVLSRIVSENTPSIGTFLLDLRWPGFKPVSFESIGQRCIITLEPREKFARCPHCGQLCYKRHSCQTRVLRDAPLFAHDQPVLRVRTPRYRCSCGHTCTQCVDFAEPRAKVTKALTLYCQQLLRFPALTLSAVSILSGLSIPTLKQMDKQQLKYCFEHVTLNHVKNIAIDEFSVHKNHKYATVVIDNDTCQVLWVGRGNSKKAVQPFFDLLKQRGVDKNIRSVACDQHAAFACLVRDNLPGAAILFDFFHVLSHWRTDVLKEAKKTTQQRVSARLKDQAQHNALELGTEVNKPELHAQISQALSRYSGIDWMMLMHEEDLTPGKRKRLLETLEQDNALLASLHPLTETLRSLWKIKNKHDATRALETLRQTLHQINHKFNFKPAKKFAMMLKRRQEGIINVGRFGYTTSRLEGCNQKIKTLKRSAYGFNDMDYFFR